MIYLYIYIYIYTSVNPCITCTEQVVEMLLVSKLVEAISFSNVASFDGGFVRFFVRWLPERPSRDPGGYRKPFRGPSGSRSGRSEASLAPGAAFLKPQWLPERSFRGPSGSRSRRSAASVAPRAAFSRSQWPPGGSEASFFEFSRVSSSVPSLPSRLQVLPRPQSPRSLQRKYISIDKFR